MWFLRTKFLVHFPWHGRGQEDGQRVGDVDLKMRNHPPFACPVIQKGTLAVSKVKDVGSPWPGRKKGGTLTRDLHYTLRQLQAEREGDGW